MGILPDHIYRLLRMNPSPIYQPYQSFQHDDVQILISKMTKEWHENRGIWVIDWPPCSPDLKNIEYFWRALKDELY